ncbi:MAG: potassium-transporting ATPase subunit KdpA [Syntrophales bacterium LBB04]|nr:potassium-transporting ATPase subunit KdpA [Syntrophales bacterium LBB04]
MTGADILHIIFFLALLMLLAIPLGNYVAKVFTGRRTFLNFMIRPLESAVYRLCGIDESEEMSWKQYSVTFVLFNVEAS